MVTGLVAQPFAGVIFAGSNLVISTHTGDRVSHDPGLNAAFSLSAILFNAALLVADA